MKKLSLIIIALIAFVQGAWAQEITWTEVGSESALTTALSGESPIYIKLTANIELVNYLGIGDGENFKPTVTLDLNGHTLSRNLDAADADGHVIWIRTGSTLTVMDSSGDNSGTLTGGYANNGGGINNYGTLYFLGGTISGCNAGTTGGAIRNNGTTTFSGGVIDNCWSKDCGGIYNAEGKTLTISGGEIKNCTSNGGGGGVVNYGTATISGGSINNNHCLSRGGGVWNGSNATLTIEGGTITGNIADVNGGGIFSYSSFSMSGAPAITNNTTNGSANNLYLNGSNTKINVTGSLSGANIHVTLSNNNRVITSGYNTHNSGTNPSTIFSPDYSGHRFLMEGNEVKHTTTSETATLVETESELNTAINNGDSEIQLLADIALSDYINISDGKTVTLDLNGHKLDRGLNERIDLGNVIRVQTGCTLTIKDNSGNNSGTIKGGYDSHGGAICNYGTVTLEGGTITGCTGSSYGGAVYVVSGGTFTMSGGVIDGCTGDDGGAIYIIEGGAFTMSGGSITNNTCTNHSGGAINNHGTCTVSGGSITGNYAKNYGGGIGNFDNGTLTISGGTISGNWAETNGGGVYTSKSITMSGKPYIKDNEGSNLYLDGSSTKINCGTFNSGARIGVSQSDYDSQSFAPGYYLEAHNSTAATTIFSADVSGFEVQVAYDMPYIQANGHTYIECSWSGGNTDGHVVKTKKAYTGSYTTYNSNTSVSSLSSGWYLLYSTFTFSKRVTINGDVKFILANGCNVEFDKGIYIPKDNKLTIYAEGDGNNMGYLWTDGSDGENGSIGGNEDNCGGHLVIHGGKIYAKPGSNNSAGIGGGDGSSSGMQSVTIYGGNITAEGKSSGAGIGSGQENSTVPSVTIYGGSITAKGGNYAAGIGGGEECSNSTIKIFGGTVTATGGGKSGSGGGAAGIGSGEESSQNNPIYIYGGTVNATGGQCGAGIGGAYKGNGGSVYVYGGNVTATGGQYGAGIGGGYRYTSTSAGRGGTLTVTGGTVNATGGEYSSGIGGGYKAQGGTVTISNGNVTATGGTWGAGIGGGWAADGGNVTISGGSVTVAAGTGAYAIGRGADRNSGSDGSLTLGNTISVKQSGGSWVNSGSRVSTVRANGTYILQNCTHEGATYSQIDGNDGDYYHHIDCSYCEGENELHTKGDNDECTKCHKGLPQRTYTFYEANAAGTGYGDGTVYYVTETHEFTFPESGESPKYLVFAGWQLSADEPESLVVDNTEGLIAAGSTTNVPALLSSDRNYYARYTEVYFSGGEGTQNDPFLISDADDWNHLAQAVNDGINFNGMYFVMTNDISTVTTMAGQGSNRFRGNFDGQGHTLTISYTGITEDYCAPFRHISGATIKNLNTTGTIETSGRYAAGVVAYTRYYSKIENCHSSVVIRSSHAGWAGHGGILALKANVSYSNPTIEGCVFDGKILSTGTTDETKTTGGAGIVGYTNGQSLTIKNCLYKPAALGTGEMAVACATIYENASGSSSHPTTNVTCTDCYYTEVIGSVQGGTQAYTVQSGTDNLTLDYGNATTSYSYNGIKVYSFEQDSRETATGLSYDGILYTGGTTKVTFTPDAPRGYAATNVTATAGSLVDHGDYTFTLTMDSTNVSITADFTAAVTLIVDAVSDWNNASGWVFISSPVVANGGIAPSSVIGLVADPAENYDLYRFDQSNEMEWQNYKAQSFSLENGQGYLYATKDGTTLIFTGDFNTATEQKVPLLYETTNSDANMHGWNLVGNPFTEEAYINRSYYKMNSTGSGIEAVSDYSSNPIEVCTGIMVQAEGVNDTITFSTTAPSQQNAANNGGLYIALTQVVEPVETPVNGSNSPATLRQAQGPTLLDNAIITFNEDSQLGKFYFGTQNANIYLPQNGQDYAIAFSEGQGEMPLNFKTKENGTYTLSVNPEGAEMAYLHLIDNMTGADVDLLAGCGDARHCVSTYTFTAKTTDYASRFKLVFSICGDANGDNETFAFISNGNLIVNGEGMLQVIDMMGRVIVSRDAARYVSTNGMAPGVYVLRLIDGENIKVQKIVIR